MRQLQEKKMIDPGINTVADLMTMLENTTLPAAIQSPEVGDFFHYKSGGGLFDNDFTFEIVEEHKQLYIIEIEGQMRVPLKKDYKLLEAFETKDIEFIGRNLYEQ